MLPANSSSTTLSASRWSVQLTCPSGGLLHAMATRCASCLPLSLRSRPGRGRSLMAASSPSSTNRLRALATVRALTETASATCGPTALRQLSATQGPALPCGPTACPDGIPQSDRTVGMVSVRLCTLWQAYPGTASLEDHTQAYSVSHTISILHGTSTRASGISVQDEVRSHSLGLSCTGTMYWIFASAYCDSWQLNWDANRKPSTGDTPSRELSRPPMPGRYFGAMLKLKVAAVPPLAGPVA